MLLSCSLFSSHREVVQETHFQIIFPYSKGRKQQVSNHPGTHQKISQDIAFQIKEGVFCLEEEEG